MPPDPKIAYWEIEKDGSMWFLDIYSSRVVYGSGMGNSESVGHCSIDEFLAGMFHKSIIESMGSGVLKKALSIAIDLKNL